MITTLYRFYGKNKELLYVGISNDVGYRLGSHKDTKFWWDEVDTIKLKHYKDRSVAGKIESRAIKILNPKYNIVHSKNKNNKNSNWDTGYLRNNDDILDLRADWAKGLSSWNPDNSIVVCSCCREKIRRNSFHILLRDEYRGSHQTHRPVGVICSDCKDKRTIEVQWCEYCTSSDRNCPEDMHNFYIK